MMKTRLFNNTAQKDVYPLLLTLLFFLGVILLSISKYDYNLTSMIVINADNQPYQNGAMGSNYVILDGQGHDGQYYYYIARGFFEDFPLLKGSVKRYYARIIYPLLIGILSWGGHTVLLPYVMVGVNLLSILVATYFLIQLLKAYHVNIWLSLVFSLNLGHIIGVQYNLKDPVSYCFAVIGIYFYEKKKIWSTTIFFGLSFLTAESPVVIIFVIMLRELYHRKFANVFRLSVIFVIYFLLNLYYYPKLGEFPFMITSKIVRTPFNGIIETLKTIQWNESWLLVLKHTQSIPFMLFCLLTLLCVGKKLIQKVEIYDAMILLYLILGSTLYYGVWNSLNSARVLLGMFLCIVLSNMKQEERCFSYLLFTGSLLLTGLGIIRIILAPAHLFFITK